MMRKKERQRLIKQLLTSNNIQRQEDFVSLLDKQGIKVTQATVSRDIKDMQLVKVPSVTMKVLPGSGPVISSLMYQMNYSGIFGTLGDDNTVLIICKTEADAINMRNQINSMLGTE